MEPIWENRGNKKIFPFRKLSLNYPFGQTINFDVRKVYQRSPVKSTIDPEGYSMRSIGSKH